MTVTVVDREVQRRNWGSPGVSSIHRSLQTVEIADTCPICGGPRGAPVSRPFCEDGEHYAVDCWSNRCGHVDRYKDVLVEAREIRERTLECAR